jgi:hypothetical protein
MASEPAPPMADWPDSVLRRFLAIPPQCSRKRPLWTMEQTPFSPQLPISQLCLSLTFYRPPVKPPILSSSTRSSTTTSPSLTCRSNLRETFDSLPLAKRHPNQKPPSRSVGGLPAPDTPCCQRFRDSSPSTEWQKARKFFQLAFNPPILIALDRRFIILSLYLA